MLSQFKNYSKYSEIELRKMLDETNKEIIKTKADEIKIKNKLKSIIQKEHFIKDALMEKWRMPSNELLEAIKEIQSGGGTICENMQEFDKAMKE